MGPSPSRETGPQDWDTRFAEMVIECTRDNETADRQHGLSAHATLLEAAGVSALTESTAVVVPR